LAHPKNKKEMGEEPDWAEIYTTLLAHTNLSYDEIGKRTIKQINAILSRLGKHINIKVGLPLFGTEEEEPVNPGRQPTISELARMCGILSGEIKEGR
jgi:hypothetical protein